MSRRPERMNCPNYPQSDDDFWDDTPVVCGVDPFMEGHGLIYRKDTNDVAGRISSKDAGNESTNRGVKLCVDATKRTPNSNIEGGTSKTTVRRETTN